MREKIAEWLHNKERAILKVAFPGSAWNVPWDELLLMWQEHFCKDADELSTLLKEEIKKSLLEGKEITGAIMKDGSRRGSSYSPKYFAQNKKEFQIVAQAQLDKTLKIVEEG